MKVLVVAFALVASVCAEGILNEYLPPTEEYAALGGEYTDAGLQQGALAQDGYRYKTVRRHRHRRDVNELLSGEYLPPTGEYASLGGEYANVGLEQGSLAQDGYRYKTVRRHRHRRDVNELLSGEYLPPTGEYASLGGEYSALGGEYANVGLEQGSLAQDGYRYKTVRRHRHRRDVNELLSGEYLPPTGEYASLGGEYSALGGEYANVGLEQGSLAQDGYRYKTVRRHRHRRDVNELANNEYLPPVAESYSAPAFAAEQSYSAPAFAAEQSYSAPAFAAEQSYSAPTFAAEQAYASPAIAEHESIAAPIEQVHEAAPAHVLAEDGYRYKTVRKYKVRRH